ncbi:MAG: hypothetical protein AAGA95_17065 [Pseudomonadota bacterium]
MGFADQLHFLDLGMGVDPRLCYLAELGGEAARASDFGDITRDDKVDQHRQYEDRYQDGGIFYSVMA